MNYSLFRVSTPAGKLELLEFEPVSEFGWKSWKAIGSSPALAGKAGILFLGLIASNGINRWKTILSRNRFEEEKIVHYHVRQALFTKSTQDWKFSLYFARVVGRPLLSGGGYRKILNLTKEFQFIGNFKVIQYFVKIVELHLHWLEFHIKIHGMAGKQCAVSAQKAGKRSLSSETLAGISTLTRWTPCYCGADFVSFSVFHFLLANGVERSNWSYYTHFL